MKGQAVFEFVIAAILFFAIVFYIFNQVNGTVYAYQNERNINSLEAAAMRISELLVHTKGVWSSGIPLSPGLEEDWPVLNTTKILRLNSSCNSDYEGLARMLGIDPERNSLDIIITEFNGNVLADCPKTLPDGIPYAHARRTALSESKSLLRVDVFVW